MSASSVYVPGRLSPRDTDRLRALFRFLFSFYAAVEVRGREHLPASGGFIVCINHLSRLDAPLVFGQLDGRKVTAFAADTYRPNPFFKLILEMVDVIWVHRGAIGPSTIKAALQALRAGRVLGVAPEGTRSLTHTLQAGKAGAASLAVAAGAPIVPAAITGTEHLSRAITRFFPLWRGRVPVTLQFGEPFTLPPLGRGERAEKLDAYTDEIMCRIAALLPAQYRGVYAGHPRLVALLSSRTGPSAG